jgi:hypothetical protein
MKKVMFIISDIFFVVAGWLFGVLNSISGLAVLVTAESRVQDVHPIFHFPEIYYIAGAIGFIGLGILIRRAARRII